MADKVLLSIDDDPQVLGIIREVALGLGYRAETVVSAGSFMTAYATKRPSVITIDICMPEIDGIELLRWLVDVGSTARVVIVSGAHPSYGEMAQRLARAIGTMDVSTLRKPFRLAELRAALSGEITSSTVAPGSAPAAGAAHSSLH